MKIETHHIPSKGFNLSLEESANGFASLNNLMDTSDCNFVAPIKIDLNVAPMRDFIRVKGSIETTVEQPCVRCLEDFQSGLKSRFTLNYSNEIPQDLHDRDQKGIELTAQQIGIMFYRDDEIDFTDAIQEQVVMALPYRPICRDDCKGLCSQCGQNMNKNKCQCGSTAKESPFSVLKNMKLPPQ